MRVDTISQAIAHLSVARIITKVGLTSMTLADRFEQEIEVRGHLIDSMILTRIFDRIMDLQGDFHVIEFTVGKKKGDASYARLLVKGKSREHLDSILEQVFREGAQPVSVQEVRLEPAPKDMVMPD
ncbi:MAG TPA: hypothetical protein VI338_01965, partial [Nitrososphaera sp.]|nr:hypothetical protein [Nitrososphaera sp.]